MPNSPTQNSHDNVENILNSRPLKRVVVLGANGTMGFQSGALFAGAGLEVVFLARTRDKAEDGRRGAEKAVRASAVSKKITVGSYSEDLAAAVKDADLVFEAVAENFDIKDKLFADVDAHRKKDSIVATVSSGLSISDLAAGRSESFQKNFLGLHFFNPPQVIVGTELIPGDKTDPEVMDFIDHYVTRRLGRITIRTANTAGFAGNRIGFKVLNEVAQLAEEIGPLLCDRLVGCYTGRAMTPLATIDLVGWDVHRAIVDNICDKLEDEAIDTLKMPAYMRALLEKGMLGAKSGGGFFKSKKGEERQVLDIASGNYVPVSSVSLPKLDFIDEAVFHHRMGSYEKAMGTLLTATGKEADIAKKVVAGYISYALCRVGEVCNGAEGIDLIMGAGFNWAPPSVLVDTLGLKETVALIEGAGLRVPPVLAHAVKDGFTGRFFNDSRLNIGKFFVAK